MEFNINLGKLIKDLRKGVGLTQIELSEGICSQALISKVEKGEHSPSAELLNKIAKRLKVDIEYLVRFSIIPRLDYVKVFTEEVRKLVRKKEYIDARRLVKREKMNPLIIENVFNQQFIFWNEGIFTYYIDGESKKALNLLERALHITDQINKIQLSEIEIEILMSKAIILSEIERFDDSIKIYQDCLLHLKRLPHVGDYKIEIRILYNLTKTLIDIGKYQEALPYSEQGIRLCINKETMYLLGEFYYQRGRTFQDLNQREDFLENMTKAKNVFELTGSKYFEIVNKYLK